MEKIKTENVLVKGDHVKNRHGDTGVINWVDEREMCVQYPNGAHRVYLRGAWPSNYWQKDVKV